jgi:hypothetical protein
MVDGAQEKDKRARETIQRLKEEMKKLSQLVDQVLRCVLVGDSLWETP